eukprot:353367-Chlamydomonas_euryale.AAC.2
MHILNAARLTSSRHMARIPEGSVVKQLLFAEGLVGLGGVVGRPHCKWRDRAVAALSLAHLGHIARMPDASVVKQLLFAEGLVGLGGVVGRPCSTWQDTSLAALRPVLTTHPSGAPFVTVPSPLFDPLCHAALKTGIPCACLLPLRDSDITRDLVRNLRASVRSCGEDVHRRLPQATCLQGLGNAYPLQDNPCCALVPAAWTPCELQLCVGFSNVMGGCIPAPASLPHLQERVGREGTLASTCGHLTTRRGRVAL